jgi:hypothetical protein
LTVRVLDPFGAAADPALPSLALALDPVEVRRAFGRPLPRLAGHDGAVQVRAVRVTRHKPGRRCVVEYDLAVERPGAPPEAITLVGKVRAGRFGKSGYRLLGALREAGFGPDSPDGISVPEPLGTLPAFRMWLQRKVPGRVATELLAAPGGMSLARRIAEAAHKVHRAGVPAEKRHTMADELRILHACLPTVAAGEPRWSGRLERLLDACARLGAATPEPAPQGIHRDFYGDQVIVDSDDGRLYLLDFDLYCAGDPGLDLGNFLGHITEHSLRTRGDPGALEDVERAMEERFVELAGEALRASVRAYATLTLGRHVYLSTRFAERRAMTGALLELCEARLGLATHPPFRAAAAAAGAP